MLAGLVSRRARGCAILDGGMGTALETRGVEQAWSSALRLDEEHVKAAVKDIYKAFLLSGADLITVNTYNVSAEALMSKFAMLPFVGGIAEADTLVHRLFKENVELAMSAVEEYVAGGGAEPVLVGSLGCYGTCVAGRAETANREGETGADDEALLRLPAYGVGKQKLVEFHARRVNAAVAAGLRLLAFETVPDLTEAEAIAEVMNAHSAMEADGGQIEAWVTFTCRSNDSVDNGALFIDCVAALKDCACITGVGVNCTAPEHVVPLLEAAAALNTGKVLVCYPNSGETYLMRPLRDGETEPWKRDSHEHGGKGVTQPSHADLAEAWHAAGARVIGGCCRVTEGDIHQLSGKFPRVRH
jgi:homocysteine S-methyltransferase